MPKNLTTLTIAAMIGFWIGVITARNPFDWEIFGPSAYSSQAVNCSQQPTESQSAKPAESLTVAPKTEHLSVSVHRPMEESSPPGERLVPVPDNLFTVNNAPPDDQPLPVRRLPPATQTAPFNAGRYAAEYPQTPIPFYPNTGLQ